MATLTWPKEKKKSCHWPAETYVTSEYTFCLPCRRVFFLQLNTIMRATNMQQPRNDKEANRCTVVIPRCLMSVSSFLLSAEGCPCPCYELPRSSVCSRCCRTLFVSVSRDRYASHSVTTEHCSFFFYIFHCRWMIWPVQAKCLVCIFFGYKTSYEGERFVIVNIYI